MASNLTKTTNLVLPINMLCKHFFSKHNGTLASWYQSYTLVSLTALTDY